MDAENGVWSYIYILHSARIRKVSRLFGDEFHFGNIKYPFKI